MSRFAGKVVVVTGAASGIGLSAAEQFAVEGADVVATDINEETLQSALQPLAERGLKVEGLRQDVAVKQEWEALAARVLNQHGRWDVLVNNAGTGIFAGIEEITEEDWAHVMNVNLAGVCYGMQAAIAAMKEKGGAIVNVSSIAGIIGEPKLAAYSATKGGVRAMTKSAAVDCARRGYPIRINSIHPGYTVTPLVQRALESLGDAAEKFAAETTQRIPAGRLADPVEIARPILFLASDDASYMIGSELVVDGGYTAS